MGEFCALLSYEAIESKEESFGKILDTEPVWWTMLWYKVVNFSRLVRTLVQYVDLQTEQSDVCCKWLAGCAMYQLSEGIASATKLKLKSLYQILLMLAMILCICGICVELRA